MTPTERRRWIEAVLTNDETATDSDLVRYFMAEGSMSEQVATALVAQRPLFLNGDLP